MLDPSTVGVAHAQVAQRARVALRGRSAQPLDGQLGVGGPPLGALLVPAPELELRVDVARLGLAHEAPPPQRVARGVRPGVRPLLALGARRRRALGRRRAAAVVVLGGVSVGLDLVEGHLGRHVARRHRAARRHGRRRRRRGRPPLLPPPPLPLGLAVVAVAAAVAVAVLALSFPSPASPRGGGVGRRQRLVGRRRRAPAARRMLAAARRRLGRRLVGVRVVLAPPPPPAPSSPRLRRLGRVDLLKLVVGADADIADKPCRDVHGLAWEVGRFSSDARNC